MKRNFKSTSAKVLAVALAVGMVATSLPATVADAKKKVKKPTLGKTKVTINVGKTAKITVKKNKGPKVKKVTIKLSKKQKKLVKVTKKTKSYIKVKGLKAGKTTLKVKIKAGKKTYTQKLKVTVVKAKPPVVTSGPTTATSNQPGSPTPSASAGTGTPAPSSATGSQAPSSQAPSSQAPSVEKPNPLPDLTLTYDYAFPAARQVLFEDADEGYPAYGIDARDYEKIIVKVAAAKEIEKVDGWAGKVTISSTDESLGFTAYTDGFYVKYLNDMPYEDGVYTIEFDISDAPKGYEIDDLELVDCISLQLSGTNEGEPNSYDDVTLKEISLIARTAPLATPDPDATPAPTATPIDTSKETNTAKVGDLTLDTSKSDITTLKATKDASGADVIRLPFTSTNQRVFFDVSDIDFTQIASIKITADVPAQMTFDIFSKDLDKNADSWWNSTYVKAGYPFYNAKAGTKTTYTCTMTSTDLKDGVKLTNIGYLALGSHNGPAGKDPFATASYNIYSIEFVKKAPQPTKDPGATDDPNAEASITISAKPSTTVAVGKTLALTSALTYPEEITKPKVAYTSSDTNIATVRGTSSGTITAVAAGKVTITGSITVNEKEYTDTIEITVKERPAEDISINLANATGLSGAGVSEATENSVKLTFNSQNNQSIKVSVEIPEGEDLNNYWGFAFELADFTVPEDATLIVGTYKYLSIETQGKNDEELTGIQMGTSSTMTNAELISICPVTSGKKISKSSGLYTWNLSAPGTLAKARTTTGTIDLAIGIDDLPVGSTIVIKNVKLLAANPA